MITVSLILMIVAFVLFVLAALLVNVPKVNLVAVGLAFWELAQLIADRWPQ